MSAAMKKIDFFQDTAKTRDAAGRRRKMQSGATMKRVSEDYLDFGFDYFDNPDLGIGYGGYRYDGRYADAAAEICRYYNLSPGSTLLELGCAKGYLLYEFHLLGIKVAGLDISAYALSNAHPEIRRLLCLGDVAALPFCEHAFDLIIAKELLPHVPEDRLSPALSECCRVSRGAMHFVIQVGRMSTDLKEMALWDPAHKVLKPKEWWQGIFQSLPVKPDVFFKYLF